MLHTALERMRFRSGSAKQPGWGVAEQPARAMGLALGLLGMMGHSLAAEAGVERGVIPTTAPGVLQGSFDVYLAAFLDNYVELKITMGRIVSAESVLVEQAFERTARQGRLTASQLKDFIARAPLSGSLELRRVQVEFAAGRYLAAADALGEIAARGQTTSLRAKDPGRLLLHQGLLFFLGGDYASALHVLEQSLATTTKATALSQWIDLQFNVGAVAGVLAYESPPEEAPRWRSRAEDAYQNALTAVARDARPRVSALAQLGLAEIFVAQSTTGPREERIKLLLRAAEAYRAALKDSTLTALPSARVPFGEALVSLAFLQNDLSERARLGAEAVKTFEIALTTWTKEASPRSWARLQYLLGRALFQTWAADLLGAGTKVSEISQREADAYRAALTVITRQSSARQWGMLHFHLGEAVQRVGLSLRGEEKLRMMIEAEESFRAALPAITDAGSRAEWAELQNSLAGALRERARETTSGEDRTRLFVEAAKAYRAGQTYYTRDTRPADWVRLQSNLALTLRDQRRAEPGDATLQMTVLQQEIEVYRKTLPTTESMRSKSEWGLMQGYLATALRAQAELVDEPEKTRLIAEADEARRTADTVLPPRKQ